MSFKYFYENSLKDIASKCYSSKEELFISLIVPSYSKEDLKIKVSNNKITVIGKKSTKPNTTTLLWDHTKVPETFEKVFYVENSVSLKDLVAKCADGVLTITLPFKKDFAEKEFSVD